jgi:ABC-2 type transport system ATP-binding protein
VEGVGGAVTPGTPLIEVTRLSKRYRRVEALSDVTFAVRPGEIFGLLGPDGAGKSSLIQVLAGVLLPTRGAASVTGLDVGRDPEGVKGRIGYMPQGLGLNLYDDLTVGDHLEFFAELRGVPTDRFLEHRKILLDITRLALVSDRLARHLSGGMRQKLGLACALIHLPDVLLLDEPTTGVDPLSRQDFWHIINRLSSQRRITVLLATPYLDEAERCHRVALLNHGRLLALGSPDELKARLIVGASAQRTSAQMNGGQISMEDVFISLLAPDGEGTGHLSGHRPDAAVTARRGEKGPAIVVDALTKRFGGMTAVNEISFTVGTGEILGFLGPNGAGKTTAIKMLTGILRPTRGRGTVAGYDILRQAPDIKRTIGYMSQRFSLYPDLTVGENLHLFARIYGLRGRRKREREDTVIEAGGLREWRGTLARDLPLGIRQRLALACALLHEPPVLFLDEPTSGVDPLARRRFWEVITGLSRERRVTVLVSTHYMDEAEHCDRLALMHRGALVAVDSPTALRSLATQRRGAVIEIAAARFRDAIGALEPHYSDLSLVGSRIHVFTHAPAADRRHIDEVLSGAGAGPAAIRNVPMAMDDVFATLIGGREQAA